LPRATVLLVGLVAALALACGGDEPATRPTPEPSPVPQASPTATVTLPPPAAIEWRACGRFECAVFGVPLDYEQPAAGEIGLALMRLPARNRAARIGTLFVNPGGPGGSAVEFLRQWAVLVPSEIRERFDLLAFDPRGVGESTPLRCGVDIQKFLGLDPAPQSDEEWRHVLEETEAFTEMCERSAGAALAFYGTRNVARDMDRIREALGEEKLNYLGYSYGTVIGQVYADMFPSHIRAMVLDGAVDVSLDPDQRSLEQTLGFEAALQRFFAYCRASRCFDRDPADAVQELFERTERAPIPAPAASRPLGQGEAVWGVIGSLYSRFQWPGLANAIEQALDGDGSTMVRLVDSFWGRHPDGSYDNLLEMNVAVNCLDYAASRDPEHHRELTGEFEAKAPILGRFSATGNLICAYWDAAPDPLEVPDGDGAPVILIVGNTGDPATPYKWAVALSKQLESALLLTNDAEGHTATYTTFNTCVDQAVNVYLLELRPPAQGRTCGTAGISPTPAVP